MERFEYIKLWVRYNLYLHYLSILHSKYGVIYLPFKINKTHKLALRLSKFRGKKNKDLFIQYYVKTYLHKNNPRMDYIFIFTVNQIIFLKRTKNLQWLSHFLFPSHKIYQELLASVNPYQYHMGHLSSTELALISQKTNFSLDYNVDGCKQLLAEIINLSIGDALSYASPKQFAYFNQRDQREINSFEARRFFESDEFKFMCNLISFEYDSCLSRVIKKIEQFDLK